MGGSLDPIGEVAGWRLDEDTMAHIELILARFVLDPRGGSDIHERAPLHVARAA